MLHTKAAWLRAAAPVAVLALALTACDGRNLPASATGSRADVGENSAHTGAPVGGKPADAAGDGVLRSGQSGTVQYKEDSGKIAYEVLAQQVHVGTEADAQKMVQDPKDANGLVAATAYVKFTNKGPVVVKGLSKVVNGTEVYADGQRGGLLTGAPEDLPGCEDPVDIDNWQVGESHVICRTYMIPKGARSLEIHWADAGTTKPLVWKFDGTG